MSPIPRANPTWWQEYMYNNVKYRSAYDDDNDDDDDVIAPVSPSPPPSREQSASRL
ncbi:hypothetical protein EJ03DRAFT_325599 [Teratosphaeria nubilosa]|uniref:Uncharacterized protein n=1 Tax=Teratosphaeria nubilosa TaxID=161662 RepID=A0A6G1LFC5_9PEZI|nr:hypothetical protein EJ03DRAFT_325599 [Teratosphaeria nubilosa]